MSKNDVLHQLIHTLSKSEKRHFKIYAAKYKKECIQHQILLFDAINKQKEYDEVKLEKKLSKTTIAKNLLYEKNQLQTLILRALQDYHPEYSVSLILNNLLQQIELLKDKRQYVLTERFLNRAYKLAELHEKFLYLAKIIKLQIALKFEFKEAKWKQLSSKMLEVQKKNTVESQYYAIFLEVYQINHTHLENNKNAVREKFQFVIENPLFQDESLAITFRSKQYFFTTWSIYYRGVEDWKKLEIVCQKLKQLFEENPIFLESAFSSYVGFCGNYLGTLILNERTEEAKKELHFFKDLETQYSSLFKDSLKNIWHNMYKSFRMNIYELEDDYQAIYEEKKLDFHKDKLNIFVSYERCFMVRTCFILLKYEEALEWIKRYFAETQKEGMQHLTFHIKVIEYFIHYDLKNNRLLESLQKSIYYYARQKEIDPLYANPIISLIRKLAKPIGKKELKEQMQEERKKAFKNFLKKIEALTNEKHSFKKILLIWANKQLKEN